VNKQTGAGRVVSQSAQFVPFSHDHKYDASAFTVYNSKTTVPNPYVGSAVYATFFWRLILTFVVLPFWRYAVILNTDIHADCGNIPSEEIL
jgi:hypothetical protein